MIVQIAASIALVLALSIGLYVLISGLLGMFR